MTSGLSGSKPTSPRDVGDFFSPFFRVAFRSLGKELGVIQEFANQETFQTTNLAGTVQTDETGNAVSQGNDNALTFLSSQLPNYAASLNIEAMIGAALKFSLTLTPPYEDAVKILENRLVGYATLVKVQWGYTSNTTANNILSDIFVFQNQFPQVEFGQDITITLSGFDLVSGAGMRNTSKVIYSRTAFPTDFSLLVAILSKTKLQVDISKVPPDSTLFVPQLFPPTIEQSTTDWQFIRRLLADNNLAGHAQGAVFKVYSPNKLGNEEIAYRFLWRLQPETKRDIPMMSFNGNPLPQLFMPPEARSLRALTSDPDSGSTSGEDMTAAGLADQQNVGETTDNSEEDPTNNATSLASDEADDGETDDDEEIGAPVTTRPEPRPNVDVGTVHSRPSQLSMGDERAKGVARGAAFFANATASLTAPGMPDLLPPMLVRVDGVSSLFSGPYLVKSVKHTLDTSGYEMEVDLLRHAAQDAPGTKPVGKPVDPPDGDPDVEPEDENADEDED